MTVTRTVFHRLSGHVHAGCEGNSSASISALELRGAHLVIARVTSLAAARVSWQMPLVNIQYVCTTACRRVHRLPGVKLHETAQGVSGSNPISTC